jgi:hypothetical protein
MKTVAFFLFLTAMIFPSYSYAAAVTWTRSAVFKCKMKSDESKYCLVEETYGQFTGGPFSRAISEQEIRDWEDKYQCVPGSSAVLEVPDELIRLPNGKVGVPDQLLPPCKKQN